MAGRCDKVEIIVIETRLLPGYVVVVRIKLQVAISESGSGSCRCKNLIGKLIIVKGSRSLRL